MEEARILKVLILEDTIEDVELAKLYISTIEFECSFKHAYSKRTFLEVVHNFLPDIIVTDYKLPDYDGISALNYTLENFPDVPVIMLTGTLGEELAAKIIKMGAYDFILKENIGKISNSIIRSLREAEEKRAKIEAQVKLEVNYKNMLQLQIKLLSAQINPHFMFNALNSIQYYLLDKRIPDALDYLSTFSQLVRKTLNNSRSPSITIADEIEFLSMYLKSEKKRLNNKFEFGFNVDSNIDIEATYLPPMLLQPYIENSIIHGVSPLKDRKGKIEISFESHNESTLKCIITDNGVGRVVKSKINMKNGKHDSLGTGLTQARLEVLQELFNKNFSQNIEDLKSDKGQALGTRVEVILPLDSE